MESTCNALNKQQQAQTWWLNGIVVIFMHLLAIYALIFITPSLNTIYFAMYMFQFSAIGITMGYHRLWSHRSFKAEFPLKFILAIAGCCAFQGSIKWWVLRHRLHHRFTDTEHDPYSAKKGFLFSHILWIFYQPNYTKMKLIDASDLNSDPIVYYQHKYYPFLAIFFGLILPTWISSLWQDTIGGFFYAGVVARVICWHTTFSINSFAHLVGDQHFSLENTSRGNFLLAFVTNGEGWHNFHHQFPNDYRNGVNFFDYDPTKWLIFTSFMVGLASNLTSLPALEIERSRLEVLQEKLDARKSRVATDVKELELFNRMELNKLIDGNCHKVYLLIDGLVLDVTGFQGQHPGGSKLLRARRLKVDKFTDSTADFDGGLNIHTRSAKRQLKTFAIGFLV